MLRLRHVNGDAVIEVIEVVDSDQGIPASERGRVTVYQAHRGMAADSAWQLQGKPQTAWAAR